MHSRVRICFFVFALVWSNVESWAQLDTLVWNGPDVNRVNLVILGDGYQDFEKGKFNEDAVSLSEYLFTTTPYMEYADFFNVVQVFTPSNVSGAARDPSALIDNYYGSTFNFGGIDRLLVPTKNDVAQDVLRNNFPGYDMVMMIVNDDKYGGSGGWLATTSTNSSAPEIAVHEVGHSFGRLADEYWAGPQFARERPNMTQEDSPSSVKWKDWVGINGVGIYEHSEDPDWHRPHQNCKMRRLGPDFCSVCTEVTVERIQQLVDHLEEWTPDESQVVDCTDSCAFVLSIIETRPNSMQTEWFLDQQIQAEDSSVIYLDVAALSEGFHELECIVTDSTSLSKQDALQFRIDQVTWEINKSTTTSVSSDRLEWNYRIGPNPFHNQVHIWTDKECSVQLVDISGKVLLEKTCSPGVNLLNVHSANGQVIMQLKHNNIGRNHTLMSVRR